MYLRKYMLFIYLYNIIYKNINIEMYIHVYTVCVYLHIHYNTVHIHIWCKQKLWFVFY